ncbi:hypothetical protein [Pseudomonas citronellolis]|uniref:hypothetical protein n=1 Tax=Pseudomonas citronellolis TaxID=53408 RepID=UPI0021BEAF99|nr:hypothetical protein [Pseudomonas citronellolis]UXJ53190.1 hypothetical protein N5P21_02945 [Pseudomonas citronellolis]
MIAAAVATQFSEGPRPECRSPLPHLLLAASLLLGGCASGAGDSFTLQADLPANFKFTGDAYYVPAPGETCSVPERIGGRRPDRKFFESDYEAAAHRVEFQVPLRDKVRGCPLVLRSMRVELRGKWRLNAPLTESSSSSDTASLSFRDALPANYPGMPASGVRAVEGQCHWMFRTVGPQRYIIKLLKCQALEDGQLQKWKPGAVLQHDQLPGRTVRLAIGMSGEEEPYYGRSWLKTDAGWKPCLETKETIRCQAPPTFTDFKLPDDRTCTVYPTCTEQESRP